MTGHAKWHDTRDSAPLYRDLKGYEREQAVRMVRMARMMPGTLVCGDAARGKVGVIADRGGELTVQYLAS